MTNRTDTAAGYLAALEAIITGAGRHGHPTAPCPAGGDPHPPGLFYTCGACQGVLRAALAAGHVRRPSATQVEWTDTGLDTFHAYVAQAPTTTTTQPPATGSDDHSGSQGDPIEYDLEALRNVARHVARAIEAGEAATAMLPGDRRTRLVDRLRHSAAQAGRELFNVLETGGDR